jgi:uncharacterized protein YaaW (UPF0174 family)
MGANTTAFDEDLNPLLETASDEDLAPLVRILLEKGWPTEGLSAHPVLQECYPEHHHYADLVAEELRRFGGHSLANVWRGEGAPYAGMVRDVARRARANHATDAAVEEVEMAVLLKLVGEAWGSMDAAQRQALLDGLGVQYRTGLPSSFPLLAVQAAVAASRPTAHRLAMVTASGTSQALLGHALGHSANLALGRLLGKLVGPVGWTVSALWTAHDLAGPAYRVTVPAIVHVAMLRRKRLVAACPECGGEVGRGDRFCPACGRQLEAAA